MMAMRWVRAVVASVVVVAGVASPLPAQLELEQALGRMAPLLGRPRQYQREGKESIYTIARRFGVSASAIYNANEGDLKAGGEVLLIPSERIAPVPGWEALNLVGEPALPGAVSVVVNLTERSLYVYRDGRPIRCYPVAIGRRGWETPTGEFTIANKRKNPTWFPPKWAIEEEPVPPGPQNPLGDRWMGLSAPGYGIHATNAPSSIGRYVSHGCIRMYPEQAQELYGLVRVGTPVKIVYEPVVLGYRAEEGVVYLAYHPDPYGLGEVEAGEVRARLGEWGLAEAADEEAIGAALQAPRGIPVAVVGSSVKVSVDGKPVKFALAPIPRGEDWLAPAGPVASALGAGLEIGPGGNFVSMERDRQRVFLSPGDREALVNGEVVEMSVAPQLAAGYPLIPVAAVARALGASVGYDQESKTVLIWGGGGGSGWAR